MVFGRIRWLALLLIFAILRGSLLHSTPPFEKVQLGPGTYVSLSQWARHKGFTISWDRPNKLVAVNSTWAKLVFNVSSKKASINGLSVWLCSPVLDHRDTLYV